MDPDDHAILVFISQAIDTVETLYKMRIFDGIAHELYVLFWNDYCDQYLEGAKVRLMDESLKSHALAMQDLCMRQFLLLLHPFMPFITEELWHALGFGTQNEFIQQTNLGFGRDLLRAIRDGHPNFKLQSHEADWFRARCQFVSAILALKAQNNLATRRDLKVVHKGDPLQQSDIRNNLEKIMHRIGAKEIEFIHLDADTVNQPPPVGTVGIVTSLGIVYLPVSIDKGAERIRLGKELEKLTQHIASQEAKLANEAFVAKAPAKVIEGARAQLAENVAKREELKRLLAALG